MPPLSILHPDRAPPQAPPPERDRGPGSPGRPRGTADRTPIAETFVSIQGEGRLTGTPSWFVRASGCHLRCGWCDTPYASWAPEGGARTVEDLLAEARLERGRAPGLRHAVLTGGEPMLFAGIARLSAALRAEGWHVTIETAGSLDRAPGAADAPGFAADLMSISPKLANSTPSGDPRDPTGRLSARHERRRLRPDALQRLVDRQRDAGRETQLKFVVARAGDLAEIESLVAALEGVRPEDIMLMPEGVVVPEPASVRWVVEACLARGWRYCPRLHIELFGDTRGT